MRYFVRGSKYNAIQKNICSRANVTWECLLLPLKSVTFRREEQAFYNWPSNSSHGKSNTLNVMLRCIICTKYSWLYYHFCVKTSKKVCYATSKKVLLRSIGHSLVQNSKVTNAGSLESGSKNQLPNCRTHILPLQFELSYHCQAIILQTVGLKIYLYSLNCRAHTGPLWIPQPLSLILG